MERVPETDAYRGVADDDALVRLVDELSTEHGLEFITTRRLLCLLAGTRPTDVASLVRGTGASRRRVEEVLARLTDHLDDTADGYRVRPSAVPTLHRLARCDALLPAGFTDPPPDRRWTQLRERMRAAAAGLPPSVWRLDHVPATADTAERRAYALWANYELAGNHVLCLGDHDLTSIALTLVSPEVAVTVVDIDERILDHIATLADDWRLPVRCAFADLRAELPRSPTPARSPSTPVAGRPRRPRPGRWRRYRHGCAGTSRSTRARPCNWWVPATVRHCPWTPCCAPNPRPVRADWSGPARYCSPISPRYIRPTHTGCCYAGYRSGARCSRCRHRRASSACMRPTIRCGGWSRRSTGWGSTAPT